MRKILPLLVVMLLAGCATRPPAPQPSPRPRPVPVIPRPVPSPADYLASSVSRSLLLVRASELVAQRQPALVDEAARVAQAHRGIAAQLNIAGRRLNLLPSAELLTRDAARLAALERSPNLADDYRRTVTTALQACLISEAAFAERGASPTLRPVARFALGVCRDELARRG